MPAMHWSRPAPLEPPIPSITPRRRIGFSLTNVNAAGPVPVTCNAPDTCPAFANGYIADNRITALSDADRTQLGIQAQYKLVTGTVQTAQLFTITLWGINDVTPVGVASDPSAEVATVGECRVVAGRGRALQLCALPLICKLQLRAFVCCAQLQRWLPCTIIHMSLLHTPTQASLACQALCRQQMEPPTWSSNSPSEPLY